MPNKVTDKLLPFTKAHIEVIAKDNPTPFYLYDAKGIRMTAKRLNKAYDWVGEGGFKNFFAIKALPNPYILKLLKEEGMGVDASSLAELILAEKAGFTGEEIFFSSNNTPREDFKKAYELGAIINLDDITHLEYLEETLGGKLPELLCFRFNPGPGRAEFVNDIIGNPADAKYGLTIDQMHDAYRIAKEKGVKRFGLHTMVVSHECHIESFINTADMIFDLAVQLSRENNIQFEFINLGGGFGIPQTLEETELDIEALSKETEALYQEKIMGNGIGPIRIVSEHGRYVTGPHGYLVSKVRHIKDTYKKYVGLDASMPDLMRPGMYGAYHHITVLGKEDDPLDHQYDVTGSLCENNDKFAIDRMLPKVEVGDYVAQHDAGAHGHAMGSNYNGKLRHAEFLFERDGSYELIRREETLEDYFETLDFSKL